MNRSRWLHLEQLFHEALRRDPVQRAEWLRDQRSSDPLLVAEVERLLAAHEGDSGLEAEEPPGGSQRLGNFRLVREMASGSTSTVFEAVQEPTERTVALKVLQHQFATPEVRRRFLNESRVLARLRHPHIAQIYDAGVLRDEVHGSRAYLAMELVPGARNLMEYASAQRLEVHSRIDLFLQVCGAIHHGHVHGVIHRDVKPDNLLVDRDGHVMVIDFGVARIIEPEDGKPRTRQGEWIGTIPYMSPEHLRGGDCSVNETSDVYSLGVVLYELIAGTLPYPVSGQPALVVARHIESTPPIPLSEKVSGVSSSLVAIVQRCLEKDPTRRYGSAAVLAEELQRFLRGVGSPEEAGRREPARPMLWPLSIGAAAIALFLGMSAIREEIPRDSDAVTKSGSSESTKGRAQFSSTTDGVPANPSSVELVDDDSASAEESAAKVLQLLQEVLAAAQPSSTEDDGTVRQALDRTAERIDEFADLPEMHAQLLATLGASYHSLGEYRSAEAAYRQGLTVVAGMDGVDSPAAATVKSRLADILMELGEYGEAEQLLEEAIAVQESLAGEKRLTLANSLLYLAECRMDQGDLHGCGPLYQRAHREGLEAVGADHPRVFVFTGQLGVFLARMGQLEESERLLRRAITSDLERVGEGHLRPALWSLNLGAVLIERRKLDEAELVIRNSLAKMQEILEPDHPNFTTAWNSLAVILRERGRIEEAVEAAEKCVEIQRLRVGNHHPDLSIYLNNLGRMHKDSGDLDAAEDAYQEAFDILEAQFGADHLQIAHCLLNLAAVYRLRGEMGTAEAYLRDALDIRRAALPAGHLHILIALNNLGEFLVEMRQFDEAEEVLEECLRASARTLGNDHWLTAICRSNQALIQREFGETDRALRTLEGVLHKALREFGEDHASTIQSKLNLGIALKDSGQYKQAESYLRDSLRFYRSRLGAHHPRLAGNLLHLGSLLMWDQRIEEGISLVREAYEIRQDKLGEDHWLTAYSGAILGRGLWWNDEPHLAEPLLRAGVEQLGEQLGPEARQTQEIAAYLEEVEAVTGTK